LKKNGPQRSSTHGSKSSQSPIEQKKTISDLPKFTVPQKTPSRRRTSLIALMHQATLLLGLQKWPMITSGWPCTQELKTGSN